MARFLLLSIFLVALAYGVSAGSSAAEAYWRSVLPNSPMPSAIRDLIYSTSKAAVPTATEDNVGSVFFLEKSLQPGSKMALHFTRSATGSFVPRHVADSIPFTSSKLPEILSLLSIDPSSKQADSIRKTLAECEAKAMSGEVKRCATSLESMVEFAMSGLKSNKVRAMATSVQKGATAKQTYTITGLNKVRASELVACHAQGYAYAVFHCHTTTATAYAASLVGADGTKVQALAACHTDAAAGVEEAYKRLGLKPGSVPVCHFLPQDDLLWARA